MLQSHLQLLYLRYTLEEKLMSHSRLVEKKINKHKKRKLRRAKKKEVVYTETLFTKILRNILRWL